jgi:hypothetical protein
MRLLFSTISFTITVLCITCIFYGNIYFYENIYDKIELIKLYIKENKPTDSVK